VTHSIKINASLLKYTGLTYCRRVGKNRGVCAFATLFWHQLTAAHYPSAGSPATQPASCYVQPIILAALLLSARLLCHVRQGFEASLIHLKWVSANHSYKDALKSSSHVAALCFNNRFLVCMHASTTTSTTILTTAIITAAAVVLALFFLSQY